MSLHYSIILNRCSRFDNSSNVGNAPMIMIGILISQSQVLDGGEVVDCLFMERVILVESINDIIVTMMFIEKIGMIKNPQNGGQTTIIQEQIVKYPRQQTRFLRIDEYGLCVRKIEIIPKANVKMVGIAKVRAIHWW